jgi:hypothetical protein
MNSVAIAITAIKLRMSENGSGRKIFSQEEWQDWLFCLSAVLSVANLQENSDNIEKILGVKVE